MCIRRMVAGSGPFYPGVDFVYRSLNLINTFTQRGSGAGVDYLYVLHYRMTCPIVHVSLTSCGPAGFTSLQSEVNTSNLD